VLATSSKDVLIWSLILILHLFESGLWLGATLGMNTKKPYGLQRLDYEFKIY
jgi:hypothetical protein